MMKKEKKLEYHKQREYIKIKGDGVITALSPLHYPQMILGEFAIS